ncbi:MAG TPA: glucoamylase family protein [Gemmatimonadaceae bacterium]|nr:glucoamylase family protein [Gemmatimonadaceae bacterium]
MLSVRTPNAPRCHWRPRAWFVVALLAAGACSTAPPPVATAPRVVTIDSATLAFADDLSRRTFQWFWDTTDERTGLVPDRWPTRAFSSVAAIGFGLTAYGIGAERGYVSREAAAERVVNTLRFLWRLPQDSTATGTGGYRGFFYHFLDYDTGFRFETVELSTIDTSLMLMGALFCQQYFDREVPVEREIRALADSLYRRVEWTWAQPDAPLVSMGWRPERGWVPANWRGYDEASFLYVLALGSPTHPIDATAWPAWTSTYRWMTFQGQSHVNFAPLFGHQYTAAWIDTRGIRDAYMRERGGGIDYFENSRRAVISQRLYAIENPGGWEDYGPDIWGLTASDGPMGVTRPVDGVSRTFFTYTARGAAATEIRDDGTIAPTAAGGSIPFAPELALRALKTMRDTYGDVLYTRYGFVDAFNPTFDFTDLKTAKGTQVPGKGWFDIDHLGIDQGPILLMLENWHSELVWDEMRESPYIIAGLRRAGFTGGWLDSVP